MVRFFESLSLYRGEQRIEFEYFGQSSSYLEGEVRNLNIGKNRVKLRGLVPREVALAAQSTADALLVSAFRPGRGSKCVITGKIMEYIESGRPILALTGEKDDALAEMMGKTKIGDFSDIINHRTVKKNTVTKTTGTLYNLKSSPAKISGDMVTIACEVLDNRH